MTSDALVDVVILTWNDGPLLEHAISSVLAEDEVAVRVIVVDNGSSPPAEVPDDPRVVLHASPVNLGVAGGRNLGIGLGTAPFVLLLDSDAELRPGSLCSLLAPLHEDPAIGLAAPTFVDQPPSASAGQAPTFARKAKRLLGIVDTYASTPGDGPWWPVDVAIGACQLFRRVAYDAVGGIDESYFYGPEDVDFCLRLRAAGWRVVQVGGDAPVVHPARRRHRQVFTRAGARHAWAVTRFLWRHRRFRLGGPPVQPVRGPRS